MSVLSLHLEQMHVHVLLRLWNGIESGKHLAEVAHVDASLVKEVFEALGINRDTFLLFQILDTVWNSLLDNER